jgi:hypothetical protein
MVEVRRTVVGKLNVGDSDATRLHDTIEEYLWASDILPHEKPGGPRPQTGQSTAGGSPLAAGGVVSRASAAPDRDSGLQLPPKRAYPSLGLGSTTLV